MDGSGFAPGGFEPERFDSGRLYMDAVLRPTRSLSRGGLFVLLGVLAAFNVVMAVFFLVIGALPVPVFLGLDFVGVLVAFRVSNGRARVAERVRVSHDRVTVAYEDGGRAKTVWSTPTAFTRVSVEDHPDDGEHAPTRVRLTLRGRGLTLAARLSPDERRAFGRALERAVSEARRERYGS